MKDKKIVPRQTPLYTNCFLEANDGELLSTIDRRKALWYVSKELGVIVKEDPLTVRLKFEPAGRAVGNIGKYYQLAKENKCVVCGAEEEYNRKNVVPREYRKFFPRKIDFSYFYRIRFHCTTHLVFRFTVVMKNHTSNDVVLLCPNCHQISNIHDSSLREKLAYECDAPFASKNTSMKTVELPQLK